MSMLIVGCKIGDTVRRGKKWMYGWIHCLFRMYCKIYEVGVVFFPQVGRNVGRTGKIRLKWMYYCI